MALSYILTCAILCVSFLATSQPSDHDIATVENTGKYTSIAINKTVSTYTQSHGIRTPNYHIVTNSDKIYSIGIKQDDIVYAI